MRIKTILNEQKKHNTKYDNTIKIANVKLWESLNEMHGKPLSESTVKNNITAIETMLFHTAIFLPDNQHKRFFESLANPSDEILLEAGLLGDIVNSSAGKALQKVDAVKKAATAKVVGAAKWGAQKAGDAVGAIGNAVGAIVPQSIKDAAAARLKSIKDAAANIITRVGVKITEYKDKAKAFFAELIERFRTEDANDICSKRNPLPPPVNIVIPPELTGEKLTLVQQHESYDFLSFDKLLSGRKLLKEGSYFTKDPVKYDVFANVKYDVLANKETFDAINLAGDIKQRAALSIAILKSKKVVVKGEDLRGILTDLASNFGDTKTEKFLKTEPAPSMRQWFIDNDMEAEIAKAQKLYPVETSDSESADFCMHEPSMIEKHFGKDSEFGQVCVKFGIWNLFEGMIESIKANKVAFFISLASLCTTFFMGGGALRIAGVVFAAMVPAYCEGKAKSLKAMEPPAPEDQVTKWELLASVSRGVGTILQLLNITDLLVDKFMTPPQVANVAAGAASTGAKGIDGVVDAADQAKLDSLLNKYPVADGFKYSAGAGGTIAIYNDAGEQVFNGMIPKSMSAEVFAQMANNNQNIAPMSVGTGAQSGIDGVVDAATADPNKVAAVASELDSDVIRPFSELDTTALAKMNEWGARLKPGQYELFKSAVIPKMSDEQFTELQQMLLTAKDDEVYARLDAIVKNYEINGKVGTVEEIATNDAGTKFYKIKNKDGTEEWIPAENTPNAKDAAIDANVENMPNKNKLLALDNVKAATMSDTNRGLITELINNSNPGTAARLVALTSDTNQMALLNSMDAAVSEEYLKTFGQFKSPLTPKNIVDFGISHPAHATQIVVDMKKAYGFGVSSEYLLSTLQDNGINPGETVQIEKIGDTIKVTQGYKFVEFPAKDIADAKPTLSA